MLVRNHRVWLLQTKVNRFIVFVKVTMKRLKSINILNTSYSWYLHQPLMFEKSSDIYLDHPLPCWSYILLLATRNCLVLAAGIFAGRAQASDEHFWRTSLLGTKIVSIVIQQVQITLSLIYMYHQRHRFVPFKNWFNAVNEALLIK